MCSAKRPTQSESPHIFKSPSRCILMVWVSGFPQNPVIYSDISSIKDDHNPARPKNSKPPNTTTRNLEQMGLFSDKHQPGSAQGSKMT